MLSILTWLIPLAILAAILAVYLWPVQKTPFDEIYSKVDRDTVASLQAFRQEHPPQELVVNGMTWEYVSLGEGVETILFLHGAAGAHDIWWQQMEALKDTHRVISVTYPPVDSLGEMASGILAILEKEGIEKINLVGSSLGGYLAQYMVANHPKTIHSTVFANTFSPNDLIAEQNRAIGALLPYLPEWLVMSVLRRTFRESIYPASGNNELVLAYLTEITSGRVSKAQVLGRYRNAIDRFKAPDIEALGVPVLILEASNDPLVEKVLRKQMQETYPSAKVVNLGDVGHFPYMNQAEVYTGLLVEFLFTIDQ